MLRPNHQHILLPAYVGRSPLSASILGWLIYITLISLCLVCLPYGLPHLSNNVILAFGIIGVWRWAWNGLHVARALIYQHMVFPTIRRRAETAQTPAALYVVVTSYKMTQELNAAVYGRLFDEIARFGAPTYIAACVTDLADETCIMNRLAARKLPQGSQVRIIQQRGLGKRDAMAEALTLIAAQRPPSGAQLILMDGDTLLSHGAIAKSCAVLSVCPRVGAVTVDHAALVKGGPFTLEWYRLRFAQRHVLMSSMSLSNKLLVLTGRFSVFRAEIATSPSFIEAVRDDFFMHGRLGRIPMLTGDDKSTWYEALRNGWDLLYVPDVAIHPVEELPAGGFIRASTSLMRRWYGNMVRSNWRAIKLGPSRCGLFPWLCLLDQRISMWSSLMGPCFALTSFIAGHFQMVAAYLLWVLVSRGTVCLVYMIATGRFHSLFLVIIYYNQVMDAAMKIYALFHPDKQKWTRQNILARGVDRPGVAAALSTPYMIIVVTAYLLALTDFSNVFNLHPLKQNPTGLTHVFFAETRPVPFVRTPVR